MAEKTNDERIRVYDVEGRKCWTTSGASKATGYHRNTFVGWAEKTLRHELDFPMVIRTKHNGKRQIFIPIDEYLEWLGYRYQN